MTEANNLIERLRVGATSSFEIGQHLRKYQCLCDEAAAALSVQDARIAKLEALLKPVPSYVGYGYDNMSVTVYTAAQAHVAKIRALLTPSQGTP